MSNASDRAHARATVTTLSSLGNKVVAYLGDQGAVETVGYIDQIADYAGVDGQTVETQHAVSLLVEDVGTPRRGDRVTDENGTVWSLLDVQPDDDPQIAVWSVERR